MPLCQICKQREATVYFTQIVNGQKTDLFVCRQCAGADGIKIDLNSLITGLLALKNEEESEVPEQAQCDRCGMTVEEFNNTGRMGCSKCYEVFYEPMQGLLTRIQGNTRHHGKVPKRFETQHSVEAEIEKLKQELQECIRAEAYERAAQIRDMIRKLDSERGA
ncbi:MAG: UvrB/UvrC motif-containing protein [Clostridia bacterium]|nr:UvrB/UvrC motif-containing protein [Clostridia bacterium]